MTPKILIASSILSYEDVSHRGLVSNWSAKIRKTYTLATLISLH